MSILKRGAAAAFAAMIALGPTASFSQDAPAEPQTQTQTEISGNAFLQRVHLQTCSADGYTIDGSFVIMPDVQDVIALASQERYEAMIEGTLEELSSIWGDKTVGISIENLLTESQSYNVGASDYISGQLRMAVKDQSLKQLFDYVQANHDVFLLTDPEYFNVVGTPDSNPDCSVEITSQKPIVVRFVTSEPSIDA